MKALSLWQPWATAIARGSKRVETRGWSTRYRGPIAIHAAKRCVWFELLHYKCCWNWCGVLGIQMAADLDLANFLPFGGIVAVADLVDCCPTESFTVGELDVARLPEGEQYSNLYRWTERQLGDFSPGRFGFVLDNIRPTELIRCRGAQRIFNVPDEWFAETLATGGPAR